MRKTLIMLVLTILVGCGSGPSLQIPVNPVPVPENFPVFDVRVSNRDKMQPGYLLFAFQDRTNGQHHTVVVDEEGQLLWYRNELAGDISLLPNGNYLSIMSPIDGDRKQTRIMESSFFSDEPVKEYYPIHSPEFPEELQGGIPVDAITFHHEVFPMENGNYLTLDIETRLYPDYPTDVYDPNAPTEDKTIVGDVIIEIDPEGNVVNSYSMLDMLDPYRINYSALIPYRWGALSPDKLPDWSHGNASIHDPTDDSILVSLRHQDAIVKFSRQTGDLIWILSPHENWAPEFHQYLLTPVGGPFAWSYHQHAPQVLPNGDIILYDNGNWRASPFDGVEPILALGNLSRAVIYRVDENNMTISQVWEYTHEDIFTPFIGDADYLENGNVLTTFGGITELEDGTPTYSITEGVLSARLIEVTPDKEVVFDLYIRGETPEVGGGYLVYRAEKIPAIQLPEM